MAILGPFTFACEFQDYLVGYTSWMVTLSLKVEVFLDVDAGEGVGTRVSFHPSLLFGTRLSLFVEATTHLPLEVEVLVKC